MSDGPGTPRTPNADPALLKAVERLLHPERFAPGQEDDERSGLV